MAEWVRALAWTGDRTVPAGFESHCGKLRFATLAIPFTPLCQCLSEETLKLSVPSIISGVYARGSQTCQVSRNFRESPEITPDLQVSRKCDKISRNSGNVSDLLFLSKKCLFLADLKKCVSTHEYQ